MGSGKTISAINIYNSLYLGFGNKFSVIVTVPKNLEKEPWLRDL